MPADVIAADLPEFFRKEDFGSEALVNGGPATVNVIISARNFDLVDGDSVIETRPFEAWTETVKALQHDDTLTVNGNIYRIVKIKQELGVDRLLLHRQ